MEYVIKNDNEGEMIVNFEGKDLISLLKKDYKYIYESMLANKYTVNFDAFSLFFELVSDNRVVGFAAYFMTQSSTMTLTETYVLPEFESENLLLKNFIVLISSGTNISIVNPTRDIVEFLLINNFAVKLTDSIVTSAIGFDMLEENLLGNFNLKGITPSTNLYDLNLCSPVFLYDISTPGVCEILYLEMQPGDDEKYNCSEFRNTVDIDEYFNDIKKSFLENSDEFNQTLMDLKESLPKSFLDYNEIIGECDELSDYFEGMIDEGMADRKTAVKIRDQLKKEYENGEVTDESLALRVTFLLGEDEYESDIDAFDDIAMQFDNFCPYCHSHVSASSKYCPTCGYSLIKGSVSADDIKKR